MIKGSVVKQEMISRAEQQESRCCCIASVFCSAGREGFGAQGSPAPHPEQELAAGVTLWLSHCRYKHLSGVWWRFRAISDEYREENAFPKFSLAFRDWELQICTGFTGH